MEIKIFIAWKGKILKVGVNWLAPLLIKYSLKTTSAWWEKYTLIERNCWVPLCPQQDNLGHSAMNHKHSQRRFDMYSFYKLFSRWYQFYIFQIWMSWAFVCVGFGVASKDCGFSLVNSLLVYFLNLICSKHQVRPWMDEDRWGCPDPVFMALRI